MRFKSKPLVQHIEFPTDPSVLAVLSDMVAEQVADPADIVTDSDPTPYSGIVRYSMRERVVTVRGHRVIYRYRVIVGGNVPNIKSNNTTGE